MEQIKVVVFGAAGRVGQEVVKAVCQAPDIKLVGAVDLKAEADTLALPDGSGTVPYSPDFKFILEKCKPDVVVDFTVAVATMPAVRVAAERRVNMVIGATGFSSGDLDEMKKLTRGGKFGLFVAPNFALGAVLMIQCAKIVGKYFDHVEITELHHDRKLDAPSGTALSTAQAMLRARGKSFLPPEVQPDAAMPQPSRGLETDGINIHSVRLPGLMAHQEVLFGGAGQTLSIRHDTINRECYMPGVLMAIREITKRQGFIYGLDQLLGL
ncbi:MAG: 4-hydroxy-tetrahydrodipicolinate reductase [Dehalococcoidales bacterium]|nr:4-hydroxy-tetrahydrodipicolinate reductase [Dehalococcoidales bacterium]